MVKSMTLRDRLMLILGAIVGIAFMGCIVMLWYTYRMQHLFDDIVENHLIAFQTAEAMETALVNQKGFVSYYFLGGNPEWLRRLGEYRQIFMSQLSTAKQTAETDAQRIAIDHIQQAYAQYVRYKNQVIDHYKAGQRSTVAKLHQEARNRFFSILELCEQYKAMHTQKILHARQQSQLAAKKWRAIAVGAMLTTFILACLLAIITFLEILSPLTRLLEATGRRHSHSNPGSNVVTALSSNVYGLIADINRTHQALEKSREHLLQAEKMAMVGKLAASMAHSIRNPFTSVKMRLFSMKRSLVLNESQQEDMDVISKVVFSVSDDGPGIPPHMVEKVFQPFFTTKEEGTGLGLSIVSRIIEEHDGNIHIEPGDDRGVTFTIFLPVIEVDHEKNIDH
jgi:C4-dicarboxylate-specific signal transduction histidine kinase